MKIPDDAVRNALIAISAGLPVVGGPLSFILDKYIPSEIERKRNTFLRRLDNDIKELKDKINIKNMYTPEFQSAFNSLLQASFTEYRNEKITVFRNIILQMLQATDEVFLDQASFYAHLVIIMIPDEIRVLNIFYQLDVKNNYKELDCEEDRNVYKLLSNFFKEEDYDYISALITDLQRYSIISGSKKQNSVYHRKGIFLTSLGEKFTNYILNPIKLDNDDEQ